MNDISIEDFYKNNICNKFFDEINYIKKNPSIGDFYQPHCKDNGFSEKERLYFHWSLYGLDMGHEPCKDNKYHIHAFMMEEINKSESLTNEDEKTKLLKVFFNLTRNNLYDPYICEDEQDKKININIIRYMIKSIDLDVHAKALYYYD